MTEVSFGTCWWCRKTKPTSELLHAEGARLVGSPPLSLLRLPPKERTEVLLCDECARTFAIARHQHNVEIAEIILPPREGVSDRQLLVEALAVMLERQEIDPGRIERLHGRTVRDSVLEYLRSKETG